MLVKDLCRSRIVGLQLPCKQPRKKRVFDSPDRHQKFQMQVDRTEHKYISWSSLMKTYICLCCNKETKVASNKKNKYCSHVCQKTHEYNEFIKRWKLGLEEGLKGPSQTSGYIRRYISEKFNDTCQECEQTNVYNGKPLTLQLEHIDGNSRNNKEENLSLLCPNCHTQTPYYGSRNKGRGRGSLLKGLSG